MRYDGHADPRHGFKGKGADGGGLVREGFLDCVYGEEGKVRLGFRMGEEVDVDELFDLDIGGGDIFDDGGEEGESRQGAVHHLGGIYCQYRFLYEDLGGRGVGI